MDFKKITREVASSGEGPVPGSCEHGNEHSGSTKGKIIASEE